MAGERDYDYRRRFIDRDYYEDPYYNQGGDYDEPYYPGPYGEYPRSESRRGGYYSEPYPPRRSGRYENESYRDYDYDRYEYGRSREPYYPRDYEGGGRERYQRRPSRRGTADRGFFERAGDEIKSWFGDEEAERRRRVDDIRRRTCAGLGPKGFQRSDDRIRDDINERLTDDWYIDARDIEVSVNSRIVTLTGRVETRQEKRRAEDIIESISGVVDINNLLRVSRVPLEEDVPPQENIRARNART